MPRALIARVGRSKERVLMKHTFHLLALLTLFFGTMTGCIYSDDFSEKKQWCKSKKSRCVEGPDASCAADTVSTETFCGQQICGVFTREDSCGIEHVYDCGRCEKDVPESPLPNIETLFDSNTAYFQRIGVSSTVRVISSTFSKEQTRAWAQDLSAPVGNGVMVHLEITGYGFSSKIIVGSNQVKGGDWIETVSVDPIQNCGNDFRVVEDTFLGMMRVVYMKWSGGTVTAMKCATAGSVVFSAPNSAENVLDGIINVQFGNLGSAVDVNFSAVGLSES